MTPSGESGHPEGTGESAQNSVRAGKILVRNGEYDDGIAMYDKALAIDSRYAPAFVYKGLALVRKNELVKAEECVERAYTLDPGGAVSLAGKGYIHAIKGEWQQALDASDRAVAASGRSKDTSEKALALRVKGYTYHRMGDHAKAVEILKESASMDPESSHTRLYLGEALIGMQDYEDAIRYLQEFVTINPKFACAYYYLGIAHDASHKPESAIQDYRHALSLDSRNPNIHCGMAYAYINSHQYHDAIKKFDTALKYDRHNAAALFGKNMLGVLESQEKAIREEIQLIQLNLLKYSEQVTGTTIKNLQELLDDFKKGLNLVKNMFFVQFVVGIGLLVVAFGVAVAGNNELLALVLGITGGATTILTFITASPLSLQKNRVDFSQWMIGYFSWFNTYLNTNILLAQKAYREEKMEWEELQKINTYLKQNTMDAIQMMEHCCEFRTATHLSGKKGGPGQHVDESGTTKPAENQQEKKEAG
jgi:tetratricopeptide (TPR) repeat protein